MRVMWICSISQRRGKRDTVTSCVNASGTKSPFQLSLRHDGTTIEGKYSCATSAGPMYNIKMDKIQTQVDAIKESLRRENY